MKKLPIFFRLNFSYGSTIHLTQEELEHLRSLRLDRVEKEIEFRDGRGNSFHYIFGAKKESGTLLESKSELLTEKEFSIGLALPKSQKLDWILQKGTELGITKFHLITFLQSDRKELNENRAKKIVMGASSQSRRHTVPDILVYGTLREFLDKNLDIFYLHPNSENSLNNLNSITSIPVVGPEGGFRDEEIKLFTERNSRGYTLGRNILRIETASLYIASILKFERIRKEYD